MSEQPSAKGFILFIMQQPATKKINHTSWGTCAVAMYLKSCGAPHSPMQSWEWRHKHLSGIKNFGSVTYGQLVESIKKEGAA